MLPPTWFVVVSARVRLRIALDGVLLRAEQKRMARLKRKGKVETFSVSVSPETRKRLRKAADRAYGANVSALIEAIALEADKQEALEWPLHRGPGIDDGAFAAFMAEMAEPNNGEPAEPHDRRHSRHGSARRVRSQLAIKTGALSARSSVAPTCTRP